MYSDYIDTFKQSIRNGYSSIIVSDIEVELPDIDPNSYKLSHMDNTFYLDYYQLKVGDSEFKITIKSVLFYLFK